MALTFLGLLPGWETVLFFFLALIFFIVSAIVTFRILKNMRWPFTWVLTEDIGDSSQIAQKGRCRRMAFGDMGEEVYQLKEGKKLKFHTGQRIGFKQIAWSKGGDGLWYPTKFTKFDKKLREVGLTPTHMDLRLALSSMRKGFDNRYQEKDKWQRIMPILMIGSIIIMSLISAGTIWYFSKKNVEVASINAKGGESFSQGMVKFGEAMDKFGVLVSKLDTMIIQNGNSEFQNKTIIGGSGLVVT